MKSRSSISRVTYWIGFIQKFLITASVAIIVVATIADTFDFGREGFLFGVTQVSFVLIGVSGIALKMIWEQKSLLKRYFLLAMLANVLLLLWCFWLYPGSGYSINPFILSIPSYRVMVVSHLLVLSLSGTLVFIAVFATRTLWRDPYQRRAFLFQFPVLAKRLVFYVMLLAIPIVFGGIGVELIGATIAPPWPARELRYMKTTFPAMNSWGLNDLERRIKKPSGTTRIVFLGDSFLENYPYYNSVLGDSHHELIQKGLENIECVNLGISATGPRHYCYRMRNVGMRLSPDMVMLFIYMGNDLMEIPYQEQPLKLIDERPLPSILGTFLPRSTWLLVERLRLSEHARSYTVFIPDEAEHFQRISQMPYEDGVVALADFMHHHFFKNIYRERIEEILRKGGLAFWQEFDPHNTDPQSLQRWKILHIINQGLSGPQDNHFSFGEGPDHRIINATVSYIEQIAKDLQKHNIPLRVFLIPLDENVDPEFRNFWLPWCQDNEYARWLALQRQALFTVLEEHEIKVVDLAETLRDIPGTYRKFDGHWTKKGHRIVSKQVAETIFALLGTI